MENGFISIFSFLPLISFIGCSAAINSLGPPRLVSEAHVLETVVSEGSKVQLPCPVQGDPDSLFFEWHRGDEPLNIFHEDRFRVQNNGVLKIKSALPQDSGLYVCRAVNGFGKVDANVTLVVLASNIVKSHDSFSDSHKHDDKEPPYLINVTRSINGQLSRLVGSSVRFMCKSGGKPEPQVTWLKDGRVLNSSFASGLVRNRWSIHIRSLQEDDHGIYTCIAYNIYGHVNFSVALDVLPGDRKKPELRGIHPVNTSVKEGDSAVFQCRVKSELLPHVQWLKQTDLNEAENDGLKVIKIHGEYFRILKSSEVNEKADGSFINKLIIATVSRKDAGKYVCLGANTIGHSFRSAFLTIQENPGNLVAEVDDSSTTIFLSWLFLILPLLIIFFIIILIVAFAHNCQKSRPHLQSDQQSKTDGPPVHSRVPEDPLMGNYHTESSDGTWSRVQSSLVIDSGQPDSFSECDSSFVFLGDLNMYKDMLHKENGHVLNLYSSNILP